MLNKLHIRSKSQSSGIDQPVSVTPSAGEQPRLPKQDRRSSANKRLSSIPKFAMKSMLATPDVPKLVADRDDGNLPNEMIPVLTLLASHGNRIYYEGYFMILSELNNDGQPIPERRWTEVYGTLQGTILTMWDASLLDAGKYETSFINIADGYMRSLDSLGPELQNVIVLSTTMKNRFLLHYGTKKLYNEWTAAFRLAAFERTSLQEAYTGALLSSKGSQLHGIRALLAEAHHKTEMWCNVRFGVGMPWKRVWVVITPHSAIKERKERKKRNGLGKIELYSNAKDKKKRPLATIHRAFTAYAVFPEKAVLVNVSSLTKLECFVEFEGDPEVRESSIFIMPEQHPGIQGFETLIRTLIPMYDVFQLYGRPKRLNADKNDINSLLFGMPSLPRAHYLDVVDVFMLTALPNSSSWAANDWNSQLKELIARKMAVGFKGTGNIHRSQSSSGTRSNASPSAPESRLDTPNAAQATSDKKRAVSDPNGVPRLLNFDSEGSAMYVDANSSSSSVNKYAPAVPSPLQHSRPAPKAPGQKPSMNFGQDQPSGPGAGPGTGPSPSPGPGPSSSAAYGPAYGNGLGVGAGVGAGLAAGSSNGSSKIPESSSRSNLLSPNAAPRGPRAPPSGVANHQRVKSEGEKVESGLLSPNLGEAQQGFNSKMAQLSTTDTPPKRNSNITAGSRESFLSANDTLDFSHPASQTESRTNLFDPTYRPAHQSYADYSEYMHQYLNNMNMQNADNARRQGAPAGPPKGPAPGLSGGIATAVEDDDDSDDEPVDIKNVLSGNPRPSTPQSSGKTAQLLSTPVRTPAYSQSRSPASTPNSAVKGDTSPPQSTALTGPRLAAYPNAPGSPGGSSSRSNDSLNAPKPVSYDYPGMSSDQRRPSGPRPGPAAQPPVQKPYSENSPTAVATGASRSPTAQVPQVNPYARQQQNAANPGMYAPPQQPQMQPHSMGAPPPQNLPHQGYVAPPQGYAPPPQGYGSPSKPMVAPNMPQQQPIRYGSPGPSYYGGYPGPQGPLGGQMPPNMYGAAGQQGGMPRAYPPPNAMPNGMPNGMPAGGGPRPMPGQQGYGLRGSPNYNPYGPPQPQQNFGGPGPQQPPMPSGSAKTGPPLRSYNEGRAQQLKSVRAQALDENGFGI